MKALILGAGGFIGGELYKSLIKDDRFEFIVGRKRLEEERFSKLDGNLNLYSTQNRLDIEHKVEFDVIFNCQAWSKPQGDPQDIFYNNVNELVAFLTELPQYKTPPKFIHLSSATVDNYPLTTYAASKLCSEIVVNSFTSLKKIEGYVLEPTCVCGGASTHGMLRDVIRRLREDPNKLEVWSTYPGSRKGYVYVNDLVDIMIRTAMRECEIWRYLDRSAIVSSPDSLTVESVINIVVKTLGLTPEIDFIGEKWVDQPNVFAKSNFNLRSASEVIEITTKEIWDKINV